MEKLQVKLLGIAVTSAFISILLLMFKIHNISQSLAYISCTMLITITLIQIIEKTINSENNKNKSKSKDKE